jgi:hypothetical protein
LELKKPVGNVPAHWFASADTLAAIDGLLPASQIAPVKFDFEFVCYWPG